MNLFSSLADFSKQQAGAAALLYEMVMRKFTQAWKHCFMMANDGGLAAMKIGKYKEDKKWKIEPRKKTRTK